MTAPVTPRRAATVMLLRDDPTLEVLLLRRSRSTPFVPGAHVFPGGAVDPGDADDSLTPLIDGLDEETAATTLGVTSDALAFWVAAVRECLEEAGVLLVTEDRTPIRPDHPLFDDLIRLRRLIEKGEEHLTDVCRHHDLRLPLGEMVYVSRWITPAESPRRYDTRFFAAAMPEGQHAVPDEWEAVDASWWRPSDALDAWQAGGIELIEPTVASLTLLTDFDTTASALDALRELRGDDR